jgi:hypothetical protein
MQSPPDIATDRRRRHCRIRGARDRLFGDNRPLQRYRVERRCLEPELLFEAMPAGIAPAVGAGEPDRGAGIGAAVERLVARPQLAPFGASGKAAAREHDDLLLGDQLPDPLVRDNVRQMHEARRIGEAGDELLGGRLRQAEMLVKFLLEEADRDRPQI